MAIELIKEAFKVEEKVGKSEIQALVETEIYINPSKPNIEKILWVQGKVEILNTKIIKDKLIISGLAKFNLLYKSLEEENNIHTLDANKEFREELDIYGVDEDMISKVDSKIEYIEWNLEEEKVQLKALINLIGEVEQLKVIEAIKEIKGKDTLQTLVDRINYKEVFGREITYALVKDVLEIPVDKPEIEEILKISIDANEVESMVVDDRIIISGETAVNLIYFGENHIHSQKQIIPFNHFIEMPGVYRELKGDVKFEVVEGQYEVMSNEEGENKLLDLEIKLRVTGKVYEEKYRDLIIDAYSTTENILLEREGIFIKENFKDFKYSQPIDLDIKDIDPREILEVEVLPSILDKRYEDDNIIIEGLLSLEVYYIDRLTDELSFYKDDFPFRAVVNEEFYANTVLDVEASVENIKYLLKKDSFIVEGNIVLNFDLSNGRNIYSIKGIRETGELIDKKNKPSITIYIVQKGDALWDIAKRYNTTEEEILISNNRDSGELLPGDKIIIEKKIEGVKI